jgi:hypothetical protein
MRSLSFLLVASLAGLACYSPSQGSDNTKTSTPSQANNPPGEAAPSASPSENAPAPSAGTSPDAPASAMVIIPEKSDPLCNEKGIALSDEEGKALLLAYLDIQQNYLKEKKGADKFSLEQDPKDSLAYTLSFTDIFGTQGKIRYRFGRAQTGSNGKVVLCLDEGDKLLWAGTYRREGNKFIPDI